MRKLKFNLLAAIAFVAATGFTVASEAGAFNSTMFDPPPEGCYRMANATEDEQCATAADDLVFPELECDLQTQNLCCYELGEPCGQDGSGHFYLS